MFIIEFTNGLKIADRFVLAADAYMAANTISKTDRFLIRNDETREIVCLNGQWFKTLPVNITFKTLNNYIGTIEADLPVNATTGMVKKTAIRRALRSKGYETDSSIGREHNTVSHVKVKARLAKTAAA